MVESNPEDDSVLFSCVVVRPDGSCMCYSGFAGTMHFVLCSRRLVLALVVDNGSGMHYTRFTSIFALRAVCVGVRMLEERSLPLVAWSSVHS